MVRCNLRQNSRRDSLLRKYRSAMQRYLQDGAAVPLTISDYLESLNRRPTRDAFGAHGGS
jgi:hypothetical protein